MKTQQFIAKHGVTMSVEETGHNPNMIGRADLMTHWRCVLRSTNQPRKSMLVIFSMGSGYHGKPPTAVNVLDCLASDAVGYENAKDFADWLSEYGFDLNLDDEAQRRQYRRSYAATGKQVEGLQRILGDAAYDRLVWHTERE